MILMRICICLYQMSYPLLRYFQISDSFKSFLLCKLVIPLDHPTFNQFLLQKYIDCFVNYIGSLSRITCQILD